MCFTVDAGVHFRYKYDAALGLSMEDAKIVSDHYPVEMTIRLDKTVAATVVVVDKPNETSDSEGGAATEQDNGDGDGDGDGTASASNHVAATALVAFVGVALGVLN